MRARSWCTVSMPRWWAAFGESSDTSAPSMSTWPWSGRKMPERHLTSVVLPAPLSPRSPSTSPLLTENDTPRSALTGPNDLATSRTSRCVVVVADSRRGAAWFIEPSCAEDSGSCAVALERLGQDPAVDRQQDTGDARRQVGGEEDGRPGDVVRIDEPADRRARAMPAHWAARSMPSGAPACDERHRALGHRRAGAHGVDADAVRARARPRAPWSARRRRAWRPCSAPGPRTTGAGRRPTRC